MKGVHFWKSYLDVLCSSYGGPEILFKSNYSGNDVVLKSLFYTEILHLWAEIPKRSSDMFIWNNKDIRINNKPIWDQQFYDIGLHFISDLFDERGKLIPFDIYFSHGISRNKYLLWRGLVECISTEQKNAAKDSRNLNLPRNKVYIMKKDVTIETVTSKIFI